MLVPDDSSEEDEEEEELTDDQKKERALDEELSELMRKIHETGEKMNAAHAEQWKDREEMLRMCREFANLFVLVYHACL